MVDLSIMKVADLGIAFVEVEVHTVETRSIDFLKVVATDTDSNNFENVFKVALFCWDDIFKADVNIAKVDLIGVIENCLVVGLVVVKSRKNGFYPTVSAVKVVTNDIREAFLCLEKPFVFIVNTKDKEVKVGSRVT